MPGHLYHPDSDCRKAVPCLQAGKPDLLMHIACAEQMDKDTVHSGSVSHAACHILMDEQDAHLSWVGPA